MSATITITEDLRSQARSIPLTQLVSGIILYLPQQTFSDQQLFQLFWDLQDEDTESVRRYGVYRFEEKFHSRILPIILAHMELGGLVTQGSDWASSADQYFHIQKSHLPHRKKLLEESGALPKHDETFKRLARALAERCASSQLCHTSPEVIR